ncbi:MAG: PPOX class F420-dependent oxidoreductase [Ardenticatenaceae bacterium]|nr:PPOX class F420-dependent oxidoreductase [Ardenticatenaceae bacterium]HBY92679.1 PPOX class F420-dependent oxidoreductase [Chloroflexota bacterium]
MATNVENVREDAGIEPIPDAYRDLVERPIVAALATTLPDGTPQVTPVWFNEKDGYVYFNSAQGRLKDRAIRENPYVALVIIDPDNPYRYLAIRGPVIEISEQGVREHIDFLAKRYRGLEKYPGPADETRYKYKVAPEHVRGNG